MMSNMDAELANAVDAAYRNAITRGLYPAGSYMSVNKAEYWAEGAQAWFEVTVRTDVNGGINTRAKLKAHDPDLAIILERVYGPRGIQHVPGCVY